MFSKPPGRRAQPQPARAIGVSRNMSNLMGISRLHLLTALREQDALYFRSRGKMNRNNLGAPSDRPQQVESDFAFINSTDASEAPPENEEQPPVPEGAFTVLLVEDTPLVLQTLEGALQDAGIFTLTASRGSKRIRKIEATIAN